VRQKGQADEAYQLLVNQALPWTAMRYEGHREFRLSLYREILHGAIEREDTEALENLLSTMKKGI
jgi:hypothetical protein